MVRSRGLKDRVGDNFAGKSFHMEDDWQLSLFSTQL